MQLDERRAAAVSKASVYRTRYNVRMQRVGFTIIVVFAAGWLQLAAQTPQPFPGRPAPPRPSPAPPKTATPPPTTTPAAPATRRAKAGAANRSRSGISDLSKRPVHRHLRRRARAAIPFVRQRNAVRGAGQVLPERVEDKGHARVRCSGRPLFEVGRFREETMAYPPGVTIKDYTWNGSAGYLNPEKNGKPARFPSIIQIVPVVPGAR